MSYGTKYSTEELQKLLTEFMFIKMKGNEIQKKFNFIIPDYVLEEIVLTRNKLDKLNLNLMINLAVINNRLTKRQAKMLKNEFYYN